MLIISLTQPLSLECLIIFICKVSCQSVCWAPCILLLLQYGPNDVKTVTYLYENNVLTASLNINGFEVDRATANGSGRMYTPHHLHELHPLPLPGSDNSQRLRFLGSPPPPQEANVSPLRNFGLSSHIAMLSECVNVNDH